MSEQFTKGLWYIEHDSSFDECLIYANREEERVDICEVSTYVTVSNDDNCIDVDQIIANANLIAAAPDLYKALSAVKQSSLCESCGDDNCDECIIDKALRKARGVEE